MSPGCPCQIPVGDRAIERDEARNIEVTEPSKGANHLILPTWSACSDNLGPIV